MIIKFSLEINIGDTDVYGKPSSENKQTGIGISRRHI